MDSRVNRDVVYVLYENEWNHDCFYDENSRINGFAKSFVHFKREVESLGYRFVPTFDYKGLSDKTDAAYIISFTVLNEAVLSSVAKHDRNRCFMFVFEPYTTHEMFYSDFVSKYFGKVFVLFDDIVDNVKYFKFHHIQVVDRFIEDGLEFEERKFCVMVNSNHTVQHPKSEYGERRKAAEFFGGKPEGFDLFGQRWEGFSAWKGPLREWKSRVIKDYKFCICYENMSDQNGYITERLIECLYSKCVPIYLGPKNIYEYVPRECFINRSEFSSYEELHQYMKSMDKKTFVGYLEAAKRFIESPQFEPFSTKQLARTIREHIGARSCLPIL